MQRRTFDLVAADERRGLRFGGFLGAGEKDVAVSFSAINTKKNDKTYLTLNTTKDALKNAPGFKYGRLVAF